VLSPEQLSRMSRLLDEALPLGPEDRRHWLSTLAPEHEDLAPALTEALLNSRGAANDAGEPGALPKLAIERGPVGFGAVGPGDHVGPYQLLRQLGAGGMAEVWLAQRADGAFKREVALKLPSLSRLREDLARRFARERDILAALEHPNIARLYDAGVSPGGLPYLAMEYVAGKPLTDWCDTQRLDVRERLKLFLQVLEAVQYAHARRVLHRDIKPSNILVTDSGQVRLLDFGVAKLLAEDEPDPQLTQLFGQALTPEYASPELLLGEPAEVASDIYALGVVLNELLAGSRPYRLKPGASRTLLEQAVVEAKVHRVSTLLTDEAAVARATSREKLARRLRGDLDAIVFKALARLPAQRYSTAAALSDDLQRYLSGAPVRARPGNVAYRFGKFVLRHGTGGAAVAAGAVMATLAIGYALMRWPATPWGAGAASGTGARQGVGAPLAAGDKSIAVLPFIDMSEKRDQEYFSDGLSEELIDQLSRNPELRVIARTSSFQFKGRNEDVRAIAEKLGVAHILEGSVRKAGNALRITAQLIRASDGSHLWSHTYERGFNDIFQVQDEISSTVSQALKATLSQAGAEWKARKADTEAYNQLLQGNYVADHNTRADLEKAIGFYQAALKLDPNYALAWAKLANTTIHQASIGWVSIAEGTAAARDALQRALRVDPDLAYAHRVLGNLYEEFDWNWARAASEYQRALELDPNDLHARIALADLKAIRSGRFDERIEYSRQALARDPLDSNERWSVAWALLSAGRSEEAEATLRKLVELNPAFAGGSSFLGLSLLLMKRYPEALAAVNAESDESFKLSTLPAVYWALGQRAASDATLAELEQKYADASAFNVAEMHAWRGETDAAFHWLERAYRQRDPGMEMVRIDPLLRNLHADPRFHAMLVKMNLE
jgi:serine/threonine protein kinase/TolB-like protein/cytochrome c-type biogenesis protein CcmH/NrfG